MRWSCGDLGDSLSAGGLVRRALAERFGASLPLPRVAEGVCRRERAFFVVG